MNNECPRCLEWRKMGLSDTCPSCDLTQEESETSWSECFNCEGMVASDDGNHEC